MTSMLYYDNVDFLSALKAFVSKWHGVELETYDDEPNEETIAAIMEGDRIVYDTSVKGYTDLNELWSDLAK